MKKTAKNQSSENSIQHQEQQNLSSKAKTTFDLIDDFVNKKIPWEEQIESDRKEFGVFMVNRFMSMNQTYLETIAALQKYTVGQLEPEMVYRLYMSLFPKGRTYSTYIKAKASDTEKIANLEPLIKLFAKDYLWNKQESLSNIKKIETSKLTGYLKSYGYSDKQIKTILK